MYQFDWTLNSLPLEAPSMEPFVETDVLARGEEPVAMASSGSGEGGNVDAVGGVLSGLLVPMGENVPMWILDAAGSWRARV